MGFKPQLRPMDGVIDLDLLGKTYTYIELSVALAKMQKCRVSTAMDYITRNKKKKGAPIIELNNNQFRVMDLNKIKENLLEQSELFL